MMLGFKARFEEPIVAKRKRHTIRGYSKRRPFRVGDRCDCYVNPRQKSCRLLGRWLCVRVQEIRMDIRDGLFFVWIDGQGPLMKDEAELLARSDGFKDVAEFVLFWIGRLPFKGQIIHWDPERPVAMRRKRTKAKGST